MGDAGRRRALVAAGQVTQGIRLQPTRTDESGEWVRPVPGAYWFESKAGTWSAMPPGAPEHCRGSLSDHTVIEHEDGTISVSPSILASMSPLFSWHGFLERGNWREV
jgi:hypothetical protein